MNNNMLLGKNSNVHAGKFYCLTECILSIGRVPGTLATRTPAWLATKSQPPCAVRSGQELLGKEEGRTRHLA